MMFHCMSFLYHGRFVLHDRLCRVHRDLSHLYRS
jgi:hypothetical protein